MAGRASRGVLVGQGLDAGGGQILLSGVDLSLKVVRALGQFENPLAGLAGHGEVQVEGVAFGVGAELAVGIVGGVAVGGNRNRIVRGLGAGEIESEGDDRASCARAAKVQTSDQEQEATGIDVGASVPLVLAAGTSGTLAPTFLPGVMQKRLCQKNERMFIRPRRAGAAAWRKCAGGRWQWPGHRRRRRVREPRPDSAGASPCAGLAASPPCRSPPRRT